MKPGWKTSEAHLTLVMTLGGLALSKIGLTNDCQHELLTKVAPIAASLIAAVSYTIARTVAKVHALAAPAAPAAPAATPSK